MEERVECTACGQQVNPFSKDSVFEHPVLKVLMCKVREYGMGMILSLIFTSLCFDLIIVKSCVILRMQLFFFCISSRVLSTTQVMTSAKMLMVWMNSAGTNIYFYICIYIFLR